MIIDEKSGIFQREKRIPIIYFSKGVKLAKLSSRWVGQLQFCSNIFFIIFTLLSNLLTATL
jgi:hypothetical protein